MGDASSIEWTDATWNPIRGCSRVSAGCEHCYAEGVARRFSGPGQPYEGLVRLDAAGKPKAQWNGTVRVVPEHLADPLRWSRPRRVFVNSMSDLFHEGLRFEDIAVVFGVMAAAKKHTFQVLTKRPERAREFFAWAKRHGDGYGLLRDGMPSELLACAWEACSGEAWDDYIGSDFFDTTPDAETFGTVWPLPNVWLGVSVEDQATADSRIPVLLELPAALRWVSYEPAIGPVDFDLPRCDDCGEAADTTADDGATPWCTEHERECSYGHWLDFPSDGDFGVTKGEAANGGIVWIVVGGESGPGARPFDLAWARATLRQCREAGTRCFVKQLGADVYDKTRGYFPNTAVKLRDRKGGDPSEWPEDLRVREWPEVRP